MKKVLFATTALVATAGFASAQGITLSGSAEMGYAGGGAGVDEAFIQSFDITFRGTGETDNGLTFGARIDLEDAAQENTLTEVRNQNPDFTVFISGAFGTLTLGDTDGALAFVASDASGAVPVASIDGEESGHLGDGDAADYLDGTTHGSLGNGQILRYNNTFGDFGFAASVELGNDRTDNLDAGWALGASYGVAFAGGEVTFAGGYQEAVATPGAGRSALGVSAELALESGFTAVLAYTDYDVEGGNDFTHTGVGLGYEFGPFGVSANYGIFNNDGAADVDGWGATASYALGGGANLVLGYGDDDTTDRYSFGLRMSF